MSLRVHALPYAAARVKIFVTLDLGQSNDRAALGILFRTVRRGEFDPVLFGHADLCQFAFRQLLRFPLGTSYPDVVARVVEIVEKLTVLHPAFDVELLFDRTGVGRAVGDLLRGESIFQRQRPLSEGSVVLVPVTVTGGDRVVTHQEGMTVPKRDLVAATVVLFQAGLLRIAERIDERETLIRELVNFKQKISAAAAHDSYGNDGKVAKHDDCVTVLSLAAWGAQRDRRPGGYLGGHLPLPNSW